MGPWFGVIAGGTGTATKKEVAFDNFNLHSNACPASAHEDAATLNFKHRMTRTKINPKQADKKGFITTTGSTEGRILKKS